MSSSDDDMPLAASKARTNGINGSESDVLQPAFSQANGLGRAPLSAPKVSSKTDAALDKQNPTNGEVQPGISIRNGPVMKDDHPMKDADGTANGVKRKARDNAGVSSFAEPESSDDDVPLVRNIHPSLERACLADDK